MSALHLRPVDNAPRSLSTKPTPTASLLKPWQFDYAPSPDGADLNLLIMFHGLGDTKAPFFQLARQLNLPSTAFLSLQAPYPLPLMEHPSWTWYNTFTPLFEPLPNPDPKVALLALRALLRALTAPEVGWRPGEIHLFGWGQGGTMALELALSVGQDPLHASSSITSTSTSSPETQDGNPAPRLGSVVSVCAGLLSHPSSLLHLGTPALVFSRLRGAAGEKQLAGARRAFRDVQIVRGEREGEDMPRGRSEWEGIMRFWAQNLARRDEGWKGQGEVYEVQR